MQGLLLPRSRFLAARFTVSNGYWQSYGRLAFILEEIRGSLETPIALTKYFSLLFPEIAPALSIKSAIEFNAGRLVVHCQPSFSIPINGTRNVMMANLNELSGLLPVPKTNII